MPYAEHFMIQGQFIVPAVLPARVDVNCGFLPTKVQLIDETLFGNLGTGFFALQSAFWDFTSPTNTNGYRLNAAGTSLLPFQINAVPSTLPPPPGITLYDGTKSVKYGPLVTGGVLSKANPAQLTSVAHGLQTGDQIMIMEPLTATTAMSQLAGIPFTVTVTGVDTVTIPIDTTGAMFTATTVTSWRRIIVGPLYYPQSTVITGITQANPMVVTTATAHGLTVGQVVRLRVPAALGMVQANNLQGLITAVTATTMTFGIVPLSNNPGIDSTAFTAFAWPTVASLPFTPAQVVPIGSGPTPTLTPPIYNYDTLLDATTNVQFQGFTVGTGLLAQTTNGIIGVNPGDVIAWTAWRADV